MDDFEDTALAFAEALVAGDFEHAFTMVGPDIDGVRSPEALRDRFYAMFRGYASGEPTRAVLDPEFSLHEWPARAEGGVGWAYVSIEGEGFVEGVALTIASEGDRLLVCDIEWGRP